MYHSWRRGGRCNRVGGGREQSWEWKLVEYILWFWGKVPVDRGDDRVQGEGSWVGSVLADDGVCKVMLSILWCSDSIEDAGEYDKKPADDSQNLVGDQGLSAMALPTGEGW